MVANDHELTVWIDQVTLEMALEYGRIRARAVEDPGTAGDEGEENWAKLLREWLPSDYEVKTKGRILAHDGRASAQVDVVVLRPGYPKRFLDKKLYLAAGVAAAFECKLTLKAAHLRKARETAHEIAALSAPRRGTPYRELVAPILYGVLAHSHSWSAETVAEHVSAALSELPGHPRETLDVVAIADSCTAVRWTQVASVLEGGRPQPDPSQRAVASLTGHELISEPRMSIGSLIAYLLIRLGWEDPAARPMADYFRLAHILARSSGGARSFVPTGLEPQTEGEALRRIAELHSYVPGSRPWDEWGFDLS